MSRYLRDARSSRFVQQDLRAAVAPWIVARVLVVAALLSARLVDRKLGPFEGIEPLRLGLFAWDGSWYRAIAEHGYAGLPTEGLRFFPLYPLSGRGLGTLFLGNTAVALVVIANLAALVLGALVHRLTLRETNDVAAAHRAAWYLALVPPALGLVLAYAEPLSMVFAVGVFLGLRSRRWWWVVPFGVLAGLTRPVGLLLVVPALVEAARGIREVGASERVARACAVVAPAVGTGIYLVWVGAVYGDALQPFSVQDRPHLRGSAVDPVTHLIDVARDLDSGGGHRAGMYLAWVLVFVVLAVVVARRLPGSYGAYCVASLGLALTAENISSFERYAMSTFPFVIGLALLTRRREVDRVVGAVAAGALVAYSTLAFLGRVVP